jgi:hypothetical protein
MMKIRFINQSDNCDVDKRITTPSVGFICFK